MSKPWPPPPDLDSLQELVATADVEGFIADGAPTDEYESEADLLFEQVQHFPTDDLVSSKLLPILDRIWTQAFHLDDASLAQRQPKLRELAAQVERFFGPNARPQVRGA